MMALRVNSVYRWRDLDHDDTSMIVGRRYLDYDLEWRDTK